MAFDIQLQKIKIVLLVFSGDRELAHIHKYGRMDIHTSGIGGPMRLGLSNLIHSMIMAGYSSNRIRKIQQSIWLF